MNRTLKMWAGIALSTLIILIFLVQRHSSHERMQPVMEQKYRRTRVAINMQLTNLRQEYARHEIAYAQNTILEIRSLWDERDVLFGVLQRHKPSFPSDSLVRLETLISRQVPLTEVLAEIQRIERMNDID